MGNVIPLWPGPPPDDQQTADLVRGGVCTAVSTRYSRTPSVGPGIDDNTVDYVPLVHDFGIVVASQATEQKQEALSVPFSDYLSNCGLSCPGKPIQPEDLGLIKVLCPLLYLVQQGDSCPIKAAAPISVFAPCVSRAPDLSGALQPVVDRSPRTRARTLVPLAFRQFPPPVPA